MVWNWTPYALPLFAATAICLIVAGRASRRRAPGATPFAILLVTVAIWTAGYSFEILSEPLAQKLFWARLQYFGIVLVPVAWFVFALQYSGRVSRPGALPLAALLAIPLTTLSLLFMSAEPTLIWRQADLGEGPGFSILHVVYGPWFWVHTSYSYALWAAASLMLLLAMRRSPHVYRKQSIAVAVAVFSPWLLNVLYVAKVFALDLTPFGFAFTGVAAYWALTHRQFLDITPVARARIVEAMRDGLVVLDARDRIVDLNAAAERILRAPAASIVGRGFDDAVSRLVKLRPLTGEHNELQLEAEVSLGRQTRFFELRSWPLRGDRSSQSGRVIIFRDITSQKKIEEELRASEARLRVVTGQMPAVLWTTDADLRVTQLLGAGLQQLGVVAEEVVGAHVFELLGADEEGHPAVAAHENARDGIASTYTSRWLGRDFDCHVEPLIDRRGAPVGIVGVGLDVTERRDLEGQLRQAQKMEAIGRMAGGVAHDFNNLLTAVAGYAQLARDDIEALALQGTDVANVRHDLDAIGHASERAAAITAQLLAFSRRQVLRPRLLDLGQTLEDMDAMLRHLVGDNVELVRSVDPACHPVNVDPVQVEQVVINLLLNSRDAMPDGGKISVDITSLDLTESRPVAYEVMEPGEYVVLAVADEGIGMDEHTKAHLFEPFFSTKDEGKGTGLGLATVYGIIRQTGGHIEVISQVGTGTTFKIYFPAVPGAELGIQQVSPDLTASHLRGQETVLLVEDEQMVRQLGSRVLSSHGYRVLEAEDGPEALEVCRHHEGTIHLVVTDVVMPGMNGSELADRISSLMPDTKLLFISGYTGGALVEHGVLADGTNFLQKPFSPDSFMRTVRQVLDAGRPQ